LVASYVFYGWWDYRFLSLILASTLVDYLVALSLEKQKRKQSRKLLLFISLFFNLGLLGLFKYYNFFIESWVDAWASAGITMQVSTLSIILPVGISFYTFQTLSYTIDVYKKQLKPTSNFIQFATYVAFFPQLVAGPIERATHLLPQFKVMHKFDYTLAKSGISLIVWGLFKKMVVADNCAYFVNQIFTNPSNYSAGELWGGAVLFGFQIYGDFSGYSDIAIGVARLFGFRLMTNFKFPYFSRDIAEFWRRWHISLSTWFRDYVYIPLGGSRGNKAQQVRNIFIVFLVSGLWHGANWTFIIWGGIHACLFLPLLLLNRNRHHLTVHNLKLSHLFPITCTFLLVTIAWIFFRADSLGIAVNYISNMFAGNFNSLSIFIKSSKMLLLTLIVLFSIITMLIFEFLAFRKDNVEVSLSPITTIFVMLLIVFLGIFKNPADFIYFQF
jgi:D-alanyl-lipoteichoic acid acyltransferase DltB (MBOAT superfamily)